MVLGFTRSLTNIKASWNCQHEWLLEHKIRTAYPKQKHWHMCFFFQWVDVLLPGLAWYKDQLQWVVCICEARGVSMSSLTWRDVVVKLLSNEAHLPLQRLKLKFKQQNINQNTYRVAGWKGGECFLMNVIKTFLLLSSLLSISLEILFLQNSKQEEYPPGN